MLKRKEITDELNHLSLLIQPKWNETRFNMVVHDARYIVTLHCLIPLEANIKWKWLQQFLIFGVPLILTDQAYIGKKKCDMKHQIRFGHVRSPSYVKRIW